MRNSYQGEAYAENGLSDKCLDCVKIASSYLDNCPIKCVSMNVDDRKYLRFLEKKRPSLEVFERMVEILIGAQKKTDQLLNTLNASLLETPKAI